MTVNQVLLHMGGGEGDLWRTEQEKKCDSEGGETQEGQKSWPACPLQSPLNSHSAVLPWMLWGSGGLAV